MLTVHNLTRYLDILLPGHKYQNVPRRKRQVDLEHLLDGAVNVVLARRFGGEDFDWEGSTRDGEYGGVSVKVGEFLGVHRGRRDNQLEISPTREDYISEQTGWIR